MDGFEIRVATPDDSEAVGELLRASYPTLMAGRYDPALWARVEGMITRANPALLASGTWYVANGGAGLAGCGGWTAVRPGTTDQVEPGLAHLRHFATHPGWARKGVGRAVLQRCIEDAAAVGVTRFECWSSLGAESFYQALGFRTVGPIEVPFGPDLTFPSLRMIRDLG